MPDGVTPPNGYRRVGSFIEERVDEDDRKRGRKFNMKIVIWQKQ
jgi:hypothetical protein